MPLPNQRRATKSRRRPEVKSNAKGSPAGLLTISNRDVLHALWKRAIRGNRQAQEELGLLLQQHPGLATILKVFSGDRDAVVRVRGDSLGTDANGVERAPNWEPKRREGPWITVISGGLPSLGKRR